MMFRRLYWVAEQLDSDGRSKVTGVYTSIQDLTHKGLHWCSEDSGRSLRLTLVKPDSFNCPLGVWTSSNFDTLLTDLQEFVRTNEYTDEECVLLKQEVDKFVGATA